MLLEIKSKKELTMDNYIRLTNELELLIKIMQNDIKNLTKANVNAEILVLLQNHCYHLEVLMLTFVKSLQDNLTAKTMAV
jgi:hypothetical protein